MRSIILQLTSRAFRVGTAAGVVAFVATFTILLVLGFSCCFAPRWDSCQALEDWIQSWFGYLLVSLTVLAPVIAGSSDLLLNHVGQIRIRSASRLRRRDRNASDRLACSLHPDETVS
jgi:hypothetical protein